MTALVFDPYAVAGALSGSLLSVTSFAGPGAGTTIADGHAPPSTTTIGGEAGDPFSDGSGNQATYVGTVTLVSTTGPVTGYVGAVDESAFLIYVPHGTVFEGVGSPIHVALDTSGDNTWTIAAACFVAGTMIATPVGERAVETVAAGDLVLTAEGAAQPVRWLARRRVSRLFADPGVLPIRIKMGALGERVPARDLLVSPGHAMLIDGVLVQAGALLNGVSVVRATDMPAVFTYHHVEFSDHEVILAEGAATESFLDGVEDVGFDNWSERPAGLSPLAELAFPRARSARQVPRAIRERLAARAAALSAASARAG